MKSLAQTRCEKLAAKFFSPYKVWNTSWKKHIGKLKITSSLPCLTDKKALGTNDRPLRASLHMMEEHGWIVEPETF